MQRDLFIWAEGLPTVKNVCFTYCGLMWQGHTKELLLSARSFYTPWAMPQILSEARGLQQLQGISAWAVGGLAARLNSSRVTFCCSFSLLSFSLLISTLQFLLLSASHYLQFATSQLHLSLFCPQSQAPLTNTFQEKLQQDEKDEVCPQLPSSPPPAEAADRSLWEDDSS